MTVSLCPAVRIVHEKGLGLKEKPARNSAAIDVQDSVELRLNGNACNACGRWGNNTTFHGTPFNCHPQAVSPARAFHREVIAHPPEDAARREPLPREGYRR